jgi:hypothetical protein
LSEQQQQTAGDVLVLAVLCRLQVPHAPMGRTIPLMRTPAWCCLNGPYAQGPAATFSLIQRRCGQLFSRHVFDAAQLTECALWHGPRQRCSCTQRKPPRPHSQQGSGGRASSTRADKAAAVCGQPLQAAVGHCHCQPAGQSKQHGSGHLWLLT